MTAEVCGALEVARLTMKLEGSRLSGRKCPSGQVPCQAACGGEPSAPKLGSARVGSQAWSPGPSALLPRRAGPARGTESAWPPTRLRPRVGFALSMPQGTAPRGAAGSSQVRRPGLLTVLPPGVSQAAPETLGQQPTGEERPGPRAPLPAPSTTCCPRPSVALWTAAAPEPDGFSPVHLEVRIFLTTAVAARGQEGGFIYSHS